MTMTNTLSPAATGAPTPPNDEASTPLRGRNGQAHHRFGYVTVGLAFLVMLAFSAVPTPLYVLYQQRDHFSNIMITVVYAVYAVGVIVSLFLAGHTSDLFGRRRVMFASLVVNAISALLFINYVGLTGLIIARVVSGLAVGMTTSTATAYMVELHRGANPTKTQQVPQMLAVAVSLGGIGVGPLVSGWLAQYYSAPLQRSYQVMGIALVVLAIAVALSPETVVLDGPRKKWAPQHLTVPADLRRQFFAAAAAGMAAFAVLGVFNSLVPTFLAVTLHQYSHLVAGAVTFSAFASGAVLQTLMTNVPIARLLKVSVAVLFAGLALFSVGMWVPSLWVFVVGGIVIGGAIGILFRGAMVTAASTAPPASRAGTLAAFFLSAYIGLSVPVVGLGVATTYYTAKDVMLYFVALVAVAVVWSVRLMLRENALHRSLS